ncbi:hypothetical protein ElyMa_006457900 [Elysia marginata]|uniref:Uncharacterized protein n=1 Tax=Elysia marginata TaxID=1093978 RepID=A0AAV4I1U6_9GAST|nr:hypothetical protein ElyMa_006457900 [Elysia marginata]
MQVSADDVTPIAHSSSNCGASQQTTGLVAQLVSQSMTTIVSSQPLEPGHKDH